MSLLLYCFKENTEENLKREDLKIFKEFMKRLVKPFWLVSMHAVAGSFDMDELTVFQDCGYTFILFP